MTGSLQARLTRSLVAGMAMLLVLQAAAVWLGIRHVTESYLATRLEHEIETLLAAVELDDGGAPHLARRPLAGVYDQPFSGHYYEITAPGGTLRSRSLWDQVLHFDSPIAGERRLEHGRGPQQQPLLILGRRFRKQGHEVTITVAEDLSRLTRDTRLFQIGYAGLTALVLAALIAWQSAAVRHAMQPLARAAEAVRRLRHGEQHVLPENVPREIRPLLDEINRLQEITVARLERSRTAVGNLAHALKTPLTVLGRIAKDPGVRRLPRLSTEIEDQVDAVRRLIDRELSRARLAGTGPTASTFDPQADLATLVATLRRIYQQIDVVAETAGAGEHSRFDRQDMLELVGNVLDNACKWAKSRVRVRAARDDGDLVLVIEDDGPGAPPDMLETLATRGTRLDEHKPGHGLGLAIADEIAMGSGGTLEFGTSADLGGFRADIRLPETARESHDR